MPRGLQVFRYTHSLHVCYALKTALALVPRGLQVFRYGSYVFFPTPFTIYIFNTTTLYQLPFLKTSLKDKKKSNPSKWVNPRHSYVDFQDVTFA